MPRLKDDGALIQFGGSRRGIISAGPTKSQAAAHIIAGNFDSPEVTLAISSPRKEPITEIAASAHIASGNPPDKSVRYQIDYSTDEGATWKPIVKDWTIERRGEEPADFWSQSFCHGSIRLPEKATAAHIRFRNNGRRKYLRAETHAIYEVGSNDETLVTMAWNDSTGAHTASRAFQEDGEWRIATGKNVETRWVEFKTVPRR
jgi:hypothetical protein